MSPLGAWAYARGVLRTSGLMLLLAACARPSTPPDDGSRAIAARLRDNPEGAALLEEAPSHRVVFGLEAGILPDGTVRLVRDRPVPESAARYGHLLHHLVHGRPFDDEQVGACSRRLEAARRRERDALALEDRLRASFGLAPLPETALEARLSAYRARCR